ncbi:zinc finger protein 728-like [Ylistrum balloti]|uniref:zinc finger protein 728-like n=1 Tax=Ylistrum balloti TaxID=509963 RepID=UPI002905B44B|nr:zinc finger protein 728-like [Ylistrum balloti]
MYFCPICNVPFKSQKRLANHVLFHKETLHRCALCDIRFTSRETLKNHMLGMHGNQFYHFCFDCGKAFKSYSGFNDHNKTNHGTGAHKCDVCGKSFSCNSRLLVHKRSHSNERPFVCNRCGRRYKHKKPYRDHVCLYQQPNDASDQDIFIKY